MLGPVFVFDVQHEESSRQFHRLQHWNSTLQASRLVLALARVSVLYENVESVSST